MIELFKNQKLMGQVRTGLAFVGGILVAKGKVSQDLIDSVVGNLDSIFTGLGAVATVGASIWSAKSKKPGAANQLAEKPIAPLIVLAGCLLVAGLSGCASPANDTAQNYQTNWLADDLGEFPVLVPKN